MKPNRLNILIVDDDPDHRLLASASLHRALVDEFDVHIRESATGPEALSEVAGTGCDLMFLDYRLPGMDGLEVLSELQAASADVPVVFMTSQADRDTVVEAMKRGATDFVAKDEFGHARLLQSVRSALERAQLRRDVIRAQKLAAIGTLAGGVAHEFNNILQVVLGHSQYALAGDDHERRERALRFCRDAAEKGSRIVQQLLSFSRKSTAIRRRFQLEDAVREAIGMEEELFKRDGIDLRVNIQAAPIVIGDQSQIEQVVLNLLSNARHACTSSVTFPDGVEPAVEVTVEVRDDMAIAAVADNGVGIPAEDKARLFEAFFTTKGALGGRVYDGKSAGTGLGLTICASIVSDHGGRIDVSSRSGQGSVFTIRLPLASKSREDAPTQRVERKDRPSSGPVGSELYGSRVLVVDDEAMIAELIKQYLEDKGYIVDTAANPGDGERLASRRAYALMLFDLTMPGGMGGRELLMRIREGEGLNAETPTLAITGHPPGPADKALFEAGFRGILRKPFEIREMGRLIAETIRIG
jgi:two-component system, cell cycle sensor histidine kinase and response regulator CckA